MAVLRFQSRGFKTIPTPTDSTLPPPNRIESNQRRRNRWTPGPARSELLSETLARTSTRDACRAAADSDSVWPASCPASSRRSPPRKKDLFLRLTDCPVLLPDKRVDQA